MPHIALEYSSNIKERPDFKLLFARLHEILVDTATAVLQSCKSRALEYTIFRVGDGEPQRAFVHLEILLAEGRTSAVRQKVGSLALEALSIRFSQSINELDLQITVEVKEFPKSFYFKVPKDTV